MGDILPFIKQEYLKSKKAHIDTRDISKAEVLKWGLKLTKLIEAIVYDTKPIHYSSMVQEDLKCLIKDKKCFNIDTGEVSKLFYYA